MLNEVVYQSGEYKEAVELECGNVRLVQCGGGGYAPLYRLEYQDYHGHPQISTFFDWFSAQANFLRESADGGAFDANLQ